MDEPEPKPTCPCGSTEPLGYDKFSDFYYGGGDFRCDLVLRFCEACGEIRDAESFDTPTDNRKNL